MRFTASIVPCLVCKEGREGGQNTKSIQNGTKRKGGGGRQPKKAKNKHKNKNQGCGKRYGTHHVFVKPGIVLCGVCPCDGGAEDVLLGKEPRSFANREVFAHSDHLPKRGLVKDGELCELEKLVVDLGHTFGQRHDDGRWLVGWLGGLVGEVKRSRGEDFV